MNLSPRRRPALLGITLASAAAFAVGGSVAYATRASTDAPPSHVLAMDPPVGAGESSAAAAAGAAPASPPTTHPAEAAPRARVAPPLTLSQAVALATKRANGRLEKLEVKDGLQGAFYEMELTRRDGTDVEVTVKGRTARVTREDRDFEEAKPKPRAALPLSVSQAVALATKRANGRLEKLEVKDGLQGAFYEMELTRRDGTDVDVTVKGHTAQVTKVDHGDVDDGDGD